MPKSSRQYHPTLFGQIQEPKAGQEKMNLEQRKSTFEGIHLWNFRFTSCCFCSVSKRCLTLCNPVDCSTPPSPVFHYLPEFAQFMSTESVILSNHSVLCCPFSFCLQSFPAWVFSNELALHIRWPEYWNFSISPSDGYSGLIAFRMDSLQSKGLSRVFSITTWKHQFFSAQPSLWPNFHIHGASLIA